MAWTQGRVHMCTMQLHLLTYCERVAWWDNTAKRGRRDEARLGPGAWWRGMVWPGAQAREDAVWSSVTQSGVGEAVIGC